MTDAKVRSGTIAAQIPYIGNDCQFSCVATSLRLYDRTLFSPLIRSSDDRSKKVLILTYLF